VAACLGSAERSVPALARASTARRTRRCLSVFKMNPDGRPNEVDFLKCTFDGGVEFHDIHGGGGCTS
jgi:hypothetical protein